MHCRFGLYTAPETKRLARYWNYWHPRGMWDYRWGDQQWWPRPISMFGSGDVSAEIDHYDEINTDNEQYVVHKLWPRAGTIPKGRYFHPNGSTYPYIYLAIYSYIYLSGTSTLMGLPRRTVTLSITSTPRLSFTDITLHYTTVAFKRMLSMHMACLH